MTFRTFETCFPAVFSLAGQHVGHFPDDPSGNIFLMAAFCAFHSYRLIVIAPAEFSDPFLAERVDVVF